MDGASKSTALAPRELAGGGIAGRVRGLFRRWTSTLGGSEVEERLARVSTRSNEYGVDPFGLDIEFAKAAIAPVLWLYKH